MMNVVVTFDIDKMSDYPSTDRVGIVGCLSQSDMWKPKIVGLAKYEKLNKWTLQLVLPINSRFVFRPFLFYLPEMTVSKIGHKLRYVDVVEHPLTVSVQCPYVMAGPPLQSQERSHNKPDDDDDYFNTEYGIYNKTRCVTIYEPKNQVRYRAEARHRDRLDTDASKGCIQLEQIVGLAVDCNTDFTQMNLVPYSVALDIPASTNHELVCLPLTKQGERALILQVTELLECPDDDTQPGLQEETIRGRGHKTPHKALVPCSKDASTTEDVKKIPRNGNQTRDQQGLYGNQQLVNIPAPTKPFLICGKHHKESQYIPTDPSGPHNCPLCDGRGAALWNDLAERLLIPTNEKKITGDLWRVEYVEVNGKLDVSLDIPANEKKRRREVAEIQRKVVAARVYDETHVHQSTMTDLEEPIPDTSGRHSEVLTDVLTDELTDVLTNELTDVLTNELTDVLPDELTDVLTNELTDVLIDELTDELTIHQESDDTNSHVTMDGHTVTEKVTSGSDLISGLREIAKPFLVGVGIGAAVMTAYYFIKSK